MSAKAVDIGWAAGFFDGEGAMTTYNPRNSSGARSRRVYVHVSIAQVDREPLDRFAQIVGAGKVTGPYRAYTPGQQKQFRWGITAIADVRRVHRLLYSYLSTRRQAQFDKALAKDTR